jgi:DNA-binding transcriptional MerR regulator
MPTYSISELAQEFGVTPRAIRFYEDHGLLAPKRIGANGHQRVYTNRDRTRLKLTLRGKRLGLTLTQVAELVNMYDSPKDTQAQLERFLKVLDEHRERLEQQLEDLRLTLNEIDAHREHCHELLAQGSVVVTTKPRTAANSGRQLLPN